MQRGKEGFDLLPDQGDAIVHVSVVQVFHPICVEIPVRHILLSPFFSHLYSVNGLFIARFTHRYVSAGKGGSSLLDMCWTLLQKYFAIGFKTISPFQKIPAAKPVFLFVNCQERFFIYPDNGLMVRPQIRSSLLSLVI